MDTADPFRWIGATIDGKYLLEAVAGEGAFGIVYRGKHLGFGERIAVKCLKIPASLKEIQREEFLAAFLEEARLLHRLSRKTAGIVQALDVGAATSPGGAWTPYIVMEWLEGQSLEADLEKRCSAGMPPRSPSEAIALLAPAASALAIAHEDSVSHRDIKPSNLFLVGAAGRASLKVVDFGIAKVLTSSASVNRALASTGKGFRAFTPQYGAPEQFSPRYGATGPWTDVFAFALVLTELLTGRPALGGSDSIQLFVSATDEKHRPTPRACGASVDVAVESVLTRAVQVDPAQRYRTIGEMWSALEAARGAAVEATVIAAGTVAPPMAEKEPLPSWIRAATAPAASQVPGSTAPAPVASVPAPPGSDPRAALGATPVDGRPAPGENRVCTIVFADISGFTALSERLGPEEVKDVVDQCFHALTERIEHHGGFVDKFIGDCVMAVFGIPHASDNNPERAVLAAIEMQRALSKITVVQRGARGLRLTLRVGINTGRVFAGRVGGATRRDFTVIGDAVNVAARLQQHAPPSSIVIGRDTYRQVLGQFQLEALPAVEAKGKSEPLAAYRVVGVRSVRSAFQPTDFYGLETRFIGRVSELHRLKESLETAIAEARAQIVTLYGSAGVGRSRVLSEIGTSLAHRPDAFFMMTAVCSPLEQDTSYRLIANLLRARFHIHQGDAPDVMSRKLDRGLRWLFGLADASGELPRFPGADDASAPAATHPEHADLAGQLALLLGAGTELAGTVPESRSPDERGQQAKQRLAGALARTLALAAARVPVVVICDDIHWADSASLDLLDELGIRLPDAPLYVLCSARPWLYERRPLWGEGNPAHLKVELAPLARRHVEEMIRDRLRAVPDPPAEFVQLCAERAEGNALILEESLHLLVDAGIVERREGRPWVIHDAKLTSVALPATIQGIVQARLDRLDPESSAALAQAAVVGRVFWEEAVASVRAGAAQPSTTPLAELLAHLRARQLIRAREAAVFPGQHEYVFSELAICEGAYETLSLKVRRPMHRCVAGWLEQRARGEADSALLALHFDRGGDARRAVVEYGRAANHAAGLGQNAEAMRLFGRAAELHDESEQQHGGQDEVRDPADYEAARVASWRERVQLRLDLGDVLRRAGHVDAAERAYEQARARILAEERRANETLQPLEPLRWQARVDFRLALAKRLRGATGEARVVVERAIDLAMRGGAERETPSMWASLAALHRRERDLDACRSACMEGLRVCRSIRRRDVEWHDAVSDLLVSLGGVFYSRGQMLRAERCYRQAARFVDDKARPQAARFALNNVAATRFALGDISGARDVFLRVLALNERAGDLEQIAIVHNNLAEVALELGRGAPAVEHAAKAVRILQQLRATHDLPDALRNLADARMAQGDVGAALEAATMALPLAETGGGRVYFPNVALTLARVCRAADAAGSPARERASTARAELLACLDRNADKPDIEATVQRCRELLAEAAAS